MGDNAETGETRDITVKSKRPSDSSFKQQRLPAWQPVLTAGTVLPTFFIIGLAFIPVGIALLYFSNNITEKIYDYTYCKSFENNKHTNETCASLLEANPLITCHCKIDLQLEDFSGKVYIYYGLTNFYQNHRRYVKSRDDDQLLGDFREDPSSDCIPFAYSDDKNKQIVPCGAIANSLFSDTLELFSLAHGKVPVERTGIAWPSDRQIKFRNPKGDLNEALKNFSPPKAWRRNLTQLDTENPDNNGLQNEDLIVWMRTAALPTFRKLYRRVNHGSTYFENGLFKGNYTLNIEYIYPVTQFGGTKSFIISTTSLLGGKNPFLGYAYITVGSICLVLGIVLLIIHIKYSKNSGGITTVNQRTPYT